MAFSEILNQRWKDDVISRLLDEVVKRPQFVNLQYSKNNDTSLDIFLNRLGSGEDGFEIEVVGSSQDGLKVGKMYNVGDIDALCFSNTLVFNDADESAFEYRTGDPCFLHIPQPTQLEGLLPVEGKYLNSNHLRYRHPQLFRPVENEYKYVQFTILPSITSSGPMKCAVTSSIAYSDTVPDDGIKAGEMSIDHRILTIWQSEHILLTNLMAIKNIEKMKFVKEMLYGCEVTSRKDSRKLLKMNICLWKQDFQKVIFTISDMLYFRSEEFQKLLQQVVDADAILNPTEARTDPHGEYSVDLVPAIKCSTWPRPAADFQTRERKWPSDTVVENIVKMGFQVVAKSPATDPYPEKDFILSFSPSEKKLARNLPDKARMSYCLLKLFFKCAKVQPADPGSDDKEPLKTFHMKTALFWVAEQTDPQAWEECGLLWGVRAIARFLLDSIQNGNLPSFFVPNNNLIRHLSATDSEAVSSILRSIHENPANYIKLLIDKEWEFTRATMPADSFQQIQEHGYFDQFNWQEQMKISCYAMAKAGDYPIDTLLDNMPHVRSEAFYKQFVPDLFRSPQSGNYPFVCAITEDQLKHVDIFVQTVIQMDIDLFNVLDVEVDEDIVRSTDGWFSQEMLELYPMYDPKVDENYGEHFVAMVKLRLKFYGNIFHLICIQLMESRFKQELIHENEDAVYIINFLNQLKERRNFTEENIDDLLHFLLYFCHYTRLRHHLLQIDQQILRSMREFLQDAKHMMTVFFNPSEVYPQPVDVGDRVVTVLGECFPKTDEPAPNCCVM